MTKDEAILPPPPPLPPPTEEEPAEELAEEPTQPTVVEPPAAEEAAAPPLPPAPFSADVIVAKIRAAIPAAIPTEMYGKIAVLASAHLLLGVSYFTNVLFAFTSPLLWLALTMTIYNAGRSVLCAPLPPREPVTEETIELMVVPKLVRALNAAIQAYEEVIECREPRRALMAATGFYVLAQAAAFFSTPLLALMAVDAAAGWSLVREHAGAKEAFGRLFETELAKKGSELVRKLDKDLKWLGGAAAVLVWAFCFGLFNKALTVGFGVLVLKASGTASQPGVQEGVQTLKKHARRMTMGAGDLLQSVKAKAGATPHKAKAL